MIQDLPLSSCSCHYHRTKAGSHIPLLGCFLPSHWPQGTSSQHGSQHAAPRAAPWSRMWGMYCVPLHQRSAEVSRKLTEKSERFQLPMGPVAVTSPIWPLLQHHSMGLPPHLQPAARAQVHHGPAFQRRREAPWALKQSLLSSNCCVRRSSHLQGDTSEKK